MERFYLKEFIKSTIAKNIRYDSIIKIHQAILKIQQAILKIQQVEVTRIIITLSIISKNIK